MKYLFIGSIGFVLGATVATSIIMIFALASNSGAGWSDRIPSAPHRRMW